MKRIMLMNIKQTTINIIHSSQLTDFLACCCRRSDSSLSFSKFWSAILRECDSVCGAKRANSISLTAARPGSFLQERKGSTAGRCCPQSPHSNPTWNRATEFHASAPEPCGLQNWGGHSSTCTTWLSCLITFWAARVLFLRLRAKLSISSASFSCMSWWCCSTASSSTADCFSSDVRPLQEHKGKKGIYTSLWVNVTSFPQVLHLYKTRATESAEAITLWLLWADISSNLKHIWDLNVIGKTVLKALSTGMRNSDLLSLPYVQLLRIWKNKKGV